MIHTDAVRAESRIQLAKDRLLAKYPFHVGVLNAMPVLERAGLDTMAVAYDGERVLLLYHPPFVLGISVAQLMGVLLHEVHHVLFKHLDISPRDFPHRAARIISQEVTVNEFVTEPLPGKPILLKAYPMLAPLQSTRERYAILEKVIPVVKVVISLDDHGVWEARSEGDGGAAGRAVQKIIDDVVDKVGADKVPQELREAVWGPDAGSATEEVKRSSEGGQVPWQVVLRRYVQSVLDLRPVFNRPPRRAPELLGAVPVQARRAGKPRLMAVVDTSGSIGEEMLTQMDVELRSMSKHYDIKVTECDAQVHAVYQYDPREGLGEVSGRGGTDFRPTLARDFLREHKPDVVVYLTDGFGPAPAAAPPVPVVWCIVPGGEKPAPWGRAVYLK